jgi:hypothetical protein
MHESPESNKLISVSQQAVPRPTTLRRADLATLTDVRRELGRVYRDMRKGKVATQDGTRYTYVLKAIADLIAQSDLEARIEALERIQAMSTH